MLQDIFTSSIFTLNISKFLYKEDISNVYTKVCLHIQPHGFVLSNYNNSMCWYKEGKLHRDHDLPAIIDTCCDKMWYNN